MVVFLIKHPVLTHFTVVSTNFKLPVLSIFHRSLFVLVLSSACGIVHFVLVLSSACGSLFKEFVVVAFFLHFVLS